MFSAMILSATFALGIKKRKVLFRDELPMVFLGYVYKNWHLLFIVTGELGLLYE